MAGKYAGMRITGGLKIYPPLLRLGAGLIRGLMEIQQDPNLRVSYTPFGWVDEGGTMYIAGAPVWKGDRGKTPDYYATNYGIGLPRAVEISRRFRGVKGVTVVMVDGRPKRMPRKAALQMAAGKKKERIKLPATATAASPA
mgnify:CR=1 FL=1